MKYQVYDLQETNEYLAMHNGSVPHKTYRLTNLRGAGTQSKVDISSGVGEEPKVFCSLEYTGERWSFVGTESQKEDIIGSALPCTLPCNVYLQFLTMLDESYPQGFGSAKKKKLGGHNESASPT